MDESEAWGKRAKDMHRSVGHISVRENLSGSEVRDFSSAQCLQGQVMAPSVPRQLFASQSA